MSKEGKTGVSANTPKNIMFGAGTIHKGLKYYAEADWRGHGEWQEMARHDF